MAPDSQENGEQTADRSDEKLTPQEAYNLTEKQHMKGKTVAKMFDVTPSYVSQLKNQYEEGVQEGRESVSPSDFETDELKEAIADEAPDENPYSTTCPLCNEMIDKPDSAGMHPCPACGEMLEWSEDEI